MNFLEKFKMDDFDNVKNWDTELEIEPEELEFLYPLMKLKEEVRRILLKTQFEDKTEFLLKGMIRVKAGRDVKRHNVLNKTQKEFFAQRKCVAESLLMYKKSGIAALKGDKTIKITSTISTLIGTELENKYKEYGLHYEAMTFEEGKEILENKLCDDVESFIYEYWHDYAEWNGVSEDEMGDYMNDIDDELIESYIEGRRLSREITEEQIVGTINNINTAVKRFNRKGAPIKNTRLHELVLLFKEIDLLRPKNKDLQIIYECCDCLGLIDESLKKRWEKVGQPRASISYMKSVWKEALKAKQSMLYFYD